MTRSAGIAQRTTKLSKQSILTCRGRSWQSILCESQSFGVLVMRECCRKFNLIASAREFVVPSQSNPP